MDGIEARSLRRDALANRDRILAAAPEVFADLGADAPMEAVARRAGVGVGTLYRRFPTRESLVEALFEQAIGELISRAGQAADEADSAAAFTGFLEAMMRTPMANIVVRELMVGSGSLEARDARGARLLGELLPAVGRLVARAQEDGVIRKDFSPADVPPLLLALAAIASEARPIAPELWRRFMQLFLDGLRPEAATPLAHPPLTPEQLRSRLALLTQPDRGAAARR